MRLTLSCISRSKNMHYFWTKTWAPEAHVSSTQKSVVWQEVGMSCICSRMSATSGTISHRRVYVELDFLYAWSDGVQSRLPVYHFLFFLAALPHRGIEPAPPAVEAWSLNQWTAREVPLYTIVVRLLLDCFSAITLVPRRLRAVDDSSAGQTLVLPYLEPLRQVSSSDFIVLICEVAAF